MSFRNPILAGTTLVRTAIESANYVAGSAGWMIGRDGTAEFNGATFRGTVVVQSNQAVLFYSGVPAAGNLVLAIAPVAGTDSFGNTYAEGMSVISGSDALVAGLTGGSPLIYGVTGNSNITNSGALQATLQGTGTSAYDIWQQLGPQDKTQKDFAALQLASSSQDGRQPAHLALIYNDTGGVEHAYLTVGSSGVVLAGPMSNTVTTDTTMLNLTNTSVASNAGFINAVHASSGSITLKSRVNGDTSSRFFVTASGILEWGPGNASQDVVLQRTTTGRLTLTSGSFDIGTAGEGLRVKEGTNAKQGTATLAAGTVLVANTSVTSSSRILLTTQSPSGTVGTPYVSARVAGTSFTISSTSAADNSTVAYQIFEPG